MIFNTNIIKLESINKAHFIGIGGIGMSALALALLSKGKQVSGSDVKTSPVTERLVESGASVYIGHAFSNLTNDVDIVVVSTAIDKTNPELIKAKELNIPIYHRADLLNCFLRSHESVAVTGTHGKTSTSAMISQVLYEANYEPTALIGGQVIKFGTNSVIGSSKYLVAEVDESDQSIHKLSATYAIITNLETDHLDHYKNLDEIVSVMKKFVDNIPEYGKVILCSDCNGNKQLMDMIKDKDIITYALYDRNADYRAIDIELSNSGSKFKVLHQNEIIGSFTLPFAGEHYVANSLAVIVCSLLMGVEIDLIKTALGSYKGVKRRFEKVAEIDGTVIVDDYAHHPTEIQATLASAKLYKKPVTVAFQPHRYSRTKGLLKEFSEAFGLADRIIITDVYSAGEKQEEYNVSSLDLAKLIKSKLPNKEVYYIQTLDQISNFLTKNRIKNEMILTMGAGNITTLSKMLSNDFCFPQAS